MDQIKYDCVSDGAVVPFLANPDSAAFELCAPRDFLLPAREICIMPVDLVFKMDPGICGIILPDMGMLTKKNIETKFGIVDASNHQGVKVAIFNMNEKAFQIRQGDKVAKLLFLQCDSPSFKAMAKCSSQLSPSSPKLGDE